MSTMDNPVVNDSEVGAYFLKIAAALAAAAFLLPSLVAVAFRVLIALRTDDSGVIGAALAGIASLESGAFSFITQYWAVLPALIAGVFSASPTHAKSAARIVIVITVLSILMSSYGLDFFAGLEDHELRGFAALISGSIQDNVNNITSLIETLRTVNSLSIGFLAAAVGAFLAKRDT